MNRHCYVAQRHADEVRRIGDRADAAIVMIGVVCLVATTVILAMGWAQ